ncbi:MAG: hydantoinase B/oxoprolinase family protein [Bradyrhizobium sp.]|uniref:hydantoinase B/oxoprolinase family protein n=1 Tax=Bradyrhizobium sp. TaxID=376 RepID=UPI000B58643B|nr:hydantoinase B/oxoprolinase family protein [Bradyrhizobium sp.]ART39413.1 J485 [uncultured bacterium]MDX3969217.1 hydantoinase B/oxoprolinase family protein [Bradyrhizobium sp.]
MKAKMESKSPAAGTRPPGADAVLISIVRNGLLGVTEEMKTNLMRTAYNMIIYEALDFTVGLFDANGDTISIGLGLPLFVRGMSETVKAKLKRFGWEGLSPGDILVTNDAYLTGSHLNHFTFTMPIFDGAELCGFACCMAHWQDVGGQLGGMTTDIFSEGIQIPILKYRSGSIVNDDLVEIIKMNVRIPERAIGDLRAQVTAVTTGERGFRELIRRYGREGVQRAIQAIMDQSEAAARRRTGEIPDGVYEAESYMDDDGVDVGKRIPIKVRVIVTGEEMTVDLREVSPQVLGFFNAGATTGQALAQMAYKCLTSADDYPINDGSFRPLKVLLSPASIVSAVKPAAMRWWMTYPMTIVDTIFRALQNAIPDKVIAGHHADLLVAHISGILPVDGRFFMASIGPPGGGWGAKQTQDGVSATVCLNCGDTHNGPIEQLEAKLPIVIEHYRLRQDSGGAGRHRGGLGVELAVRALAPINLNLQVDRVHYPPWGLLSGDSGAGNGVSLVSADGTIEDQSSTKILRRKIASGDAFVLRTGGGGGFGSPAERDPKEVARDVAQGYVSREMAQTLYRVHVADA